MQGDFKKFCSESIDDRTSSWHRSPNTPTGDEEVDYGSDPTVKTPESLGLPSDSLAYQIQKLVNNMRAQQRAESARKQVNTARPGAVTPVGDNDQTVMYPSPNGLADKSKGNQNGFIGWLQRRFKRNVGYVDK